MCLDSSFDGQVVGIFTVLVSNRLVGPGMESCSAGKNGKEAIVVNNSD